MMGSVIWASEDGATRGANASVGEFSDKIRAARQAGELDEDTFVDMWAADVILKGSFAEGKDDQWFVAEVSAHIGRGDVNRALGRAAAVAAFEGVKAHAFVYGYRIGEGASAYANKRMGVKVFGLIEDGEDAD